MTAISASMVKDLREKTGAGMMDCKNALNQTEGDFEAAVDWLRTKGLAAAAKKSGRVAAEGLVGLAVSATRGAVVEVNAETDFVARNEQFQGFVRTVTGVALTADTTDAEALKGLPFPGSAQTVADELTRLVATVGENMNLRRCAVLSVQRGVVAAYMHNALADNLGKIGVLVALESTGDAGKLAELGRRIAMHVAAANPQALTVAEVDPAALERERSILVEQSRASGKPEAIIEKMVEGRLRKYYEEVVLLEQIFVMDNETRIAGVVAQAAKEIGADIQLTGFVRFELGEGIEREEKDFAAEVRQQLAG
jgi:elongation factor Ts